MENVSVRKPGPVGWAWIHASLLALLLGTAGFWLGGAWGAGIGVAAGVLAPLLIDRARERSGLGDAARATELPERRMGPAALLDPWLGVVPFTGRTAELADLVEWCLDEDAGPVRLVTGGGGAGKTRLSAELRRQMEAQGWRCASVGTGRESEVVPAHAQAAPGAPVLLLVDYAEARSGLEDLIEAAAGGPGRTRVLLVARQAG
jgi:hypothetical protein